MTYRQLSIDAAKIASRLYETVRDPETGEKRIILSESDATEMALKIVDFSHRFADLAEPEAK